MGRYSTQQSPLPQVNEEPHSRSPSPTTPAHLEEEDDEVPVTTPLLPQAGKTRNDPVDNKNHVVDLKQEKDEDSDADFRQEDDTRACRKRSIIFSNIGIFVIINTITGLLMYFFGRNKTIAGVTVFNWALLVDVLVCGLILVMVVVKAVCFLVGKISRRFRYYTSPFVTAAYTAVWAFVSLVLMPVFLTDREYESRTAEIIRNFLNIVASCSLVSVAGNILILVMERVVFGDIQGNLHESLRNERLVALIAMENDNARQIWKVLRADEPYNVLSLANLIRSGDYGLSYWLKIEPAPNEKLTVQKTSVDTAEMIMARASEPDYLQANDLLNIPHVKPKDGYRIFRLLDFNNKGRVSKDEIRTAVANIIHERKAVVDLLKSRRLIVDIVAQIIYGVVFIICTVITLVVFIGMDVYTLLVALGTTFIGLGFALSTTLTGLLESLQMLFFVRPFEIGDIVRINDGPTMQVERVTIMSTFFYSLDGYGVYFPNAKLARSKICNYRRSKDVSLDIPVYLKLGTTAEQLAIAHQVIREYLNQHPHWNPRFFFGVTETHSKYALAMLMVSLKSTWQEKLIWNKFAADLRIFTVSRLVKLGIHYEQLENVLVAPSAHHDNDSTQQNNYNTTPHNKHDDNRGKPSLRKRESGDGANYTSDDVHRFNLNPTNNTNVNMQGTYLTKHHNLAEDTTRNIEYAGPPPNAPRQQHRRASLSNIFSFLDSSNFSNDYQNQNKVRLGAPGRRLSCYDGKTLQSDIYDEDTE